MKFKNFHNHYSPAKVSSFWTVAVTIIACGSMLLWNVACSTTQVQQTAAIVQSGASIAAQLDPQLVPFLQGAQAIYSAYQGQTIPASSIDTGNAKVDAVLQKATTSAPVVAQDVKTIATAIQTLQAGK
jgi:hypothetical protein